MRADRKPRGLLHTPERNARAERVIGELRAESRIESGDVLETGSARLRVEEARDRLDRNRLRRCLGYRTAQAMDEELRVAYNSLDREAFYWEARRTMDDAVRRAPTLREQRLAEREAIFSTIEAYRLITRTRGGQGRPAPKPEGSS